MRDAMKLENPTQITRILQDCDYSAKVRAEELPEYEHREQLVLRVELRTVGGAVRRQASLRDLQGLGSHSVR